MIPGHELKGSLCYEQLRAVDDIYNLGFHYLRTLDVMNSSRLWMISMILGHEFKAPYAMNNLGLWMT